MMSPFLKQFKTQKKERFQVEYKDERKKQLKNRNASLRIPFFFRGSTESVSEAFCSYKIHYANKEMRNDEIISAGPKFA